MGWIIRMNGKGRISIPKEVRDKLSLKRGDNLVVEVADEKLVFAKLVSEVTQKEEPEGKKELKRFLTGH